MRAKGTGQERELIHGSTPVPKLIFQFGHKIFRQHVLHLIHRPINVVGRNISMTDEILGPETVISLDGQSARSSFGVNDQVEDEHWTKRLAWSRRIKRLIFRDDQPRTEQGRSGRRWEQRHHAQ